MSSSNNTSNNLFYIQPKFLLGVLFVVNLLNYVDRGIIPGATNEINTFIDNDLHTDSPDVYLGLLQSSFIIGFMIGSILFGHMIHDYGRFYLTTIGCSIWILAVMLCGIAYYTKSYVFLLFARIISGFGEASLQCSIPPWIQKTAPEEKRGIWLAIFFTAIPVGTALGYAYSSLIAASAGWQWAFFLEGLIMFPFVLFMYHISPYFPCEKHHIDEDLIENTEQPSLWEELKIVLKRPVFLCYCAAYAAQAGTLIGLSTFGSAFLMGLGYFNTESEASTIFGVLISIAGTISTPFGGYMLDKLLQAPDPDLIDEQLQNGEVVSNPLEPLVRSDSLSDGNSNSSQAHHATYSPLVTKQLSKLSLFVAFYTILGFILLFFLYFVENKVLFILMVTVGCGLVFVCNSAINMGVMLSVPIANQPFGIGINSVCLHAFGDVPAPVIVGYIKDKLAPGCIANNADDDNIAASDACRDDANGLRLTMLMTACWLIWTVLFFVLAYILIQRNITKLHWCGSSESEENERYSSQGKRIDSSSVLVCSFSPDDVHLTDSEAIRIDSGHSTGGFRSTSPTRSHSHEPTEEQLQAVDRLKRLSREKSKSSESLPPSFHDVPSLSMLQYNVEDTVNI